MDNPFTRYIAQGRRELWSRLPGTREYDARNPSSPYYNLSKDSATGLTAPELFDDSALNLSAIPEAETVTSGGSSGGGISAEEAEQIAQRDRLREQIRGRAGDIQKIYEALFGDLEALLRARDAELETQYGDQLTKASAQYADAIPDIENSYAAIGAADSTDKSDAKDSAKEGFDETTKTIGKNKESDKAKLGQYGKENRAKFEADQTAAQRNVSRADETTDIDALTGLRNDLETNLDTAGVTRATLGTEGSARKELTNLTQDAGRFESATNALDQILKSSMSGAVKQAAITAVTDSAGLSDEEKKKVDQMYGNVYSEQAAL